jgi:hypothetical protein
MWVSAKDRSIMDAALVFSGFSGLVAAFVVSAVWATRPTIIAENREVRQEQARPRRRQ